jgi:hypothetical protein
MSTEVDRTNCSDFTISLITDGMLLKVYLLLLKVAKGIILTCVVKMY